MSLQYSFLDPVPLARHLDPVTSKDAARKAQAFAGTHEEKIVAFLASIYPRAANAEQIGNAVGLKMEQVDRRRAGLIKARRIEIAGQGVFANGNTADMMRVVR